VHAGVGGEAVLESGQNTLLDVDGIVEVVLVNADIVEDAVRHGGSQGVLGEFLSEGFISLAVNLRVLDADCDFAGRLEVEFHKSGPLDHRRLALDLVDLDLGRGFELIVVGVSGLEAELLEVVHAAGLAARWA
jgi:hypothetical protein